MIACAVVDLYPEDLPEFFNTDGLKFFLMHDTPEEEEWDSFPNTNIK